MSSLHRGRSSPLARCRRGVVGCIILHLPLLLLLLLLLFWLLLLRRRRRAG